jgi:hypothetical protein
MIPGLAWLLCAASLALGLIGAAFGVLNRYPLQAYMNEVGVGVLLAVTFPLVGALVASRRPATRSDGSSAWSESRRV